MKFSHFSLIKGKGSSSLNYIDNSFSSWKAHFLVHLCNACTYMYLCTILHLITRIQEVFTHNFDDVQVSYDQVYTVWMLCKYHMRIIKTPALILVYTTIRLYVNEKTNHMGGHVHTYQIDPKSSNHHTLLMRWSS